MPPEPEASGALQHKSSLCKFFLDGRCNKGQACAFAHGESELVARVWPVFELLPYGSSHEQRDAWAVRVLQAAAPFATRDLSAVYRRARGLSGALKDAGGLRRFCETHPDELFFHAATNVIRAPSLPFARVAALLRSAAQQHGGHVALAELYDEHPQLQEALREHGGVAAICQRVSETHPQLAMAGGEVHVIRAVAALPRLALQRRVERVLAAARQVVQRLGPMAKDAEVYAFGSAVSGFGDKDSDVDMVLNVPAACLKRFSSIPGVLRALQKQFEEDAKFVVIEAVLDSKVPVLKLHWAEMDCDLSCDNLLPVFNTALLAEYAGLNDRVVALVREVKSWAKESGVHGAVHGHLSSYAFTLLGVFYAQHVGALPCLQSGLEAQWYIERGRAYNVAMSRNTDSQQRVRQADPELSLHGFACFFSREVEWGEQVVSVRTGRLLSVDECPQLRHNKLCENEDLLHIEDPFDLNRNLNSVQWQEHGAKLRAALEDIC